MHPVPYSLLPLEPTKSQMHYFFPILKSSDLVFLQPPPSAIVRTQLFLSSQELERKEISHLLGRPGC